jgi:hypothetical protein
LTEVKTLATHEVVRATFPRPVTERDELGMIEGRVIDGAVSRYSHESARGMRPTASAIHRLGAELLEGELADAHLPIEAAEKERILRQLAAVIKAFRGSPLFGLPRPRSRLILINQSVGVYAQPDFWDGKRRIFEMKSYRALPPPADVELQLQLFQLGFPGLEEVLVCLDRHSDPVAVTSATLPSMDDATARSVLARALHVGAELGQTKVLEYVDSPIVHYEVEIARTKALGS